MVDVDDLIRRIAARVSVESSHPSPVLSAAAIAEAEATLGFQLHPLLRELYQRIGNGGFGPEYLLLGLIGGHTSDVGRTATEEYLEFRKPDPKDPGWFWPEGVLPILTWGCGMYACVDCRNDAGTVLLFEPNPVDDDWSEAWFIDAPSLAEWLERWLDGQGWYGEENIEDEPDMACWPEASARA